MNKTAINLQSGREKSSLKILNIKPEQLVLQRMES